MRTRERKVSFFYNINNKLKKKQYYAIYYIHLTIYVVLEYFDINVIVIVQIRFYMHVICYPICYSKHSIPLNEAMFKDHVPVL